MSFWWLRARLQKPQPKRRHRGVAVRLLVALSAMAVLVLSASLVGLVSTAQYQRLFHETATVDVPSLVTASKLTQLAASLNGSALSIMLADNEGTQRAAVGRIEEDIASMETLIGQFPEDYALSDALQYAAEECTKLDENLRALSQQIGHRIETDNFTNGTMRRLRALEQSVDHAAVALPGQQASALREWTLAGNRTLVALARMLAIAQPAVFMKSRQDLFTLLAATDAAFANLPPDVGQTVRPFHQQLTALLAGESNALTVKLQRFAADQRILIASNRTKLITDHLILITSAIANGVEERVVEHSEEFVKHSRFWNGSLVFISVSCIGVTIALIVYLNIRVIRRLHALVDCMLRNRSHPPSPFQIGAFGGRGVG